MNIFNFQSYKLYLTEYLNQKHQRGVRSKLAISLNCQPGYISQVLNGNKTNFSLEHLERVGSFLNLNENEMDYLILLGQYEKAGSHHLKQMLLRQIQSSQQSELTINKKVLQSGKVLSDKEKEEYYSHWSYMGIHMLISIEQFNSRKAIQKYFKLSSDLTNKVIDFLTSSGLIAEQDKRLSIGKTRIHLDPSSPFINSLHQNLRNKAIQSLENKSDIDLHYSSVLILSKEDMHKIKEMILEFIKAKEKILIPSPEEGIVALNIDYFQI